MRRKLNLSHLQMAEQMLKFPGRIFFFFFYLHDQISHYACKLQWFNKLFKNFFTKTLSPPPPQSESPEEEELQSTLNSLSAELHKLDDIHWICPLMQCSEEVGRKTACICLCMCLREDPLYYHSGHTASVTSDARSALAAAHPP